MTIYTEDDLLSRAVADYLELKNIGVFGTDIFVDERPSSPINCLTIYDTGGFPPQKDTTSDPTIEIISRNKSLKTGLTKLHEAHKLLREKYNFWLKDNKIWVIQLEAQGEPGKIGRDDNGYHLFSANYHLWVKYY